MLYKIRLSRLMNIILACILTLHLACQSSNSPQHLAGKTTAYAVARDLDRTRALMPLHNIKPSIQKPTRPSDLTSLSDLATQRIDKARSLVTQQRFTEAALELERALRHDPNHPDIHGTLAVLHWQAGNNQRAKNHAKRALETHNDLSTAHYIMGRDKMLAGNDRDAITSFRTALRCSDLHKDMNIAALCHYHLARALEDDGYLFASLEQYQSFEKIVTQRDPFPQTQELVTLIRTTKRSIGEAKSRMYEKLGRFAEAADSLQAIIRVSPPNTTRSIHYARLLLKANKIEDALQAARTIDDDNEEMIQLLFDIYERSGHPERMLADLRERIKRHPLEPRFVLSMADMLIKLNRLSEVRSELQQFLDQSPNAHLVRDRLIDVLIQQQAWPDVLNMCCEGIRNESDRVVDIEGKIELIARNPEVASSILDHHYDHDDHVMMYVRGTLALAVGQSTTAQQLFIKSFEKQPTFVPARIALGNLYLRTYRYDDALRIAQRIDENQPENVQLELILGKVYERLDDLEKAQLHLRAANQLDRTHQEMMYTLARVYHRTRKGNQAQQLLRLLLEVNPAHERGRELLAQIYSEQGKHKEAHEHIKLLFKHTDKPTTKARCKILLNPDLSSNPQLVRSQLLRAIENSEPDADTWIAIALTYSDEQLQQQQEYLQRAITLEPDNIDTLQILENNQRRQLEFEWAAETRQKMLKIYPKRFEWKLHLIDMYWNIHMFDDAVSLLKQLLENKELSKEKLRSCRIALLDTYRLAKLDDEMLEQMLVWAGPSSQNPQWPVRLADEYVRRKQYDLAIPLYRKFYQQHPTNWQIFRAMVNALQKTGQFDQAYQYALDRIQFDPDNDTAIWLLAEMLSEAGRIDEMVELIQNRLFQTLNRNAFQNLIIDHLRVKERHDQGLELIESLIDEVLTLIQNIDEGKVVHNLTLLENRSVHRLPNKPFSVETLYPRLHQLRQKYALALIAAKDLQQAVDQINLWLGETRNPQIRVGYLQLLAAAHRSEHNEKEATLTLQRALQLVPNNVPLKNDISYSWIDQGIRLDEAEKMIRFAIYRVPRQRAYLDTYGWLLYKKGDFKGAEKWIERAWRSVGRDDPVVYDHLGDTLWRLGEKNKAVEHWKKAAELTVDKTDDELFSDDERRVNANIQQKIKAGQSNGSPRIAPLALPNDSSEELNPAKD